MTAEFPKLENKYLSGITVVVAFKANTVAASIRKAFKKEETKVATYQSGRRSCFLRMTTHLAEDDGESEIHIHIDVVKASAFQGETPEVTHTKQDIEAIIDQFLGRQSEMVFVAAFDVPVDKLPENGLIRSASTETKSGTLSVQITDAQLRIRNGPVKRMRWILKSKQKEVGVILTSGKVGVLTEEFMPEWSTEAAKAFDVLALGDPNGKEAPDAS